jgi:hypothetical protein
MHSTTNLIFFCLLSTVGTAIIIALFQHKKIRALKYLYIDTCLMYECANEEWYESALAALANVNDRIENQTYKSQYSELKNELPESLIEWQDRWATKRLSNDQILRRVGVILTYNDLSCPR